MMLCEPGPACHGSDSDIAMYCLMIMIGSMALGCVPIMRSVMYRLSIRSNTSVRCSNDILAITFCWLDGISDHISVRYIRTSSLVSVIPCSMTLLITFSLRDPAPGGQPEL